MENNHSQATVTQLTPGGTIRALRKRGGMTLSDLSEKTGLAVSTISKLEKGQVSLSYDKLMLLSKGLGVDMAQLLTPPAPVKSPAAVAAVPSLGVAGVGYGRRVVHRAGEGQQVETANYKHLYLATELLNKRFTPIIGEVKARTIEEFLAEFGDLIRHPGEEFVHVLEGEVEVRTDLYQPLRLKAGDSMFFDSEMGHAYLKVSEGPCRAVVVCAPRDIGADVVDPVRDVSERLASLPVAHEPEPEPTPLRVARKKA